MSETGDGIRPPAYASNVSTKMVDKPIVSIITVVFNGASELEATMKSVINQTYPNVEYIVIDGGSRDNTVDVIKQYEAHLAYWISEADTGIYDAMNKGIVRASGEWINFMNCGDDFVDSNVLQSIFCNNHSQDAVIYGDSLYKNADRGEMYVKARELGQFWKGMGFNHQSCFVRTRLQKEMPFDTSLRIASDYKFLFNLFINNQQFCYVPMAISRFASGGLSDNNPKGLLESIRITAPTHRQMRHKVYHFKNFITCTFYFYIARLVGQSNFALARLLKFNLKTQINRMLH